MKQLILGIALVVNPITYALGTGMAVHDGVALLMLFCVAWTGFVSKLYFDLKFERELSSKTIVIGRLRAALNEQRVP